MARNIGEIAIDDQGMPSHAGRVAQAASRSALFGLIELPSVSYRLANIVVGEVVQSASAPGGLQDERRWSAAVGQPVRAIDDRRRVGRAQGARLHFRPVESGDLHTIRLEPPSVRSTSSLGRAALGRSGTDRYGGRCPLEMGGARSRTGISSERPQQRRQRLPQPGVSCRSRPSHLAGTDQRQGQ